MRCKALFCIAEDCDGQHHVDPTGHTWYEDTSDYAGNVVAHVYEISDEMSIR